MAIELRRLSRGRGHSHAFRWVRLSLRGRYFELSLKAYLLSRGCTAKQIKDLNHNLTRCRDKAVEKGLVIPPASAKARGQLSIFDRYYRSKRFEYFSTLEFIAPAGTDDYRALWRYAELCHQAVLRHFRLEWGV